MQLIIVETFFQFIVAVRAVQHVLSRESHGGTIENLGLVDGIAELVHISPCQVSPRLGLPRRAMNYGDLTRLISSTSKRP